MNLELKEIETHGGSLYNGDNYALYWCDVSSEIAFIVPSSTSSTHGDASVWDVANEPSPSSAATVSKGSLIFLCPNLMIIWAQYFLM